MFLFLRRLFFSLHSVFRFYKKKCGNKKNKKNQGFVWIWLAEAGAGERARAVVGKDQ